MRKTIKEWFESVADYNLRNKLLKNTQDSALSVLLDSLNESISRAFVWESSPEGWSYWSGIAKKAERGLIQMGEVPTVSAEDIYEDFVELMLTDSYVNGRNDIRGEIIRSVYHILKFQ